MLMLSELRTQDSGLRTQNPGHSFKPILLIVIAGVKRSNLSYEIATSLSFLAMTR